MQEKNDFLFELGCEELPPKALRKFADSLEKTLRDSLQKAKLDYANIKVFASPRRLAAYIEDLVDRQEDRETQRRGPAVQAAYDGDGNATRAALGFAKSCGVELEDLQTVETDKGACLAYTQQEKGKTVSELLPGIITASLKQLPIPKAMRWGSHQVQFVRPVHWLVMLYDIQVIECEILGLTAGRETFGHRFHHPQALTIHHPREYEHILSQEAYVIADFEKRRARIKKEIDVLAASQNLCAVMTDNLLDEVTALVEWPVPLLIEFDPDFLSLPAEALISEMADHQKCFHVCNKEGELQAYFITVSNIDSSDVEAIKQGNRRVMRARFSDAQFFFESDQKHRLEDFLERLKTVVFQAKLGTVFDKAERLANLSAYIAEAIDCNPKQAERAAWLAKCDLMSEMVNEFPDLQGVMGEHYALNDSEDESVAVAIKEHYLPRFSGDILPESPVGAAVALADRLDTLIGIFGIKQIPTGEKDPYALRRAALGIIRIIVEKKLTLDLQELLDQSLAAYKVTLPNKNVVQQVLEFCFERQRSMYHEQGFSADVIAAVLARQPTRPLDLLDRLKAVTEFREMEEAAALAAANKRVSNLLIKQGGKDLNVAVQADLLKETAEKALAEHIIERETVVNPLFAAGNYPQALAELAKLREPVDRFFDEVMVMDEDPALRQNRLALLAKLRELFLRVADISLLQ